jgi:hypothetical protein
MMEKNREALASQLRDLVKNLGPEQQHRRQDTLAAADMLEADAQPKQVTCQIYGHVVGACVECNTHIEAQQVAVPDVALAEQLCGLLGCNRGPLKQRLTDAISMVQALQDDGK